jgi:hypothetical protein
MSVANSRFTCQQCDAVEEKCTCDRFCALCQSFENVRLCGDGLYYCESCRIACEYKPEGGR